MTKIFLLRENLAINMRWNYMIQSAVHYIGSIFLDLDQIIYLRHLRSI